MLKPLGKFLRGKLTIISTVAAAVAIVTNKPEVVTAVNTIADSAGAVAAAVSVLAGVFGLGRKAGAAAPAPEPPAK